MRLTQDGCDSAEQAEQFSQNWQGMLEGLKQVAEQALRAGTALRGGAVGAPP